MSEENSEVIIYNTDDGKADVKLYSKDGVIWMKWQQMALLFDTSKQLVSHHIANVLQDKELDEKSVVKDYLTTAVDGKNYSVINELIFSLDSSCKHRFSRKKDKAVVDDYFFSTNVANVQNFFENNTYSENAK